MATHPELLSTYETWKKLLGKNPATVEDLPEVSAVLNSGLTLDMRVELLHQIGDWGTPELKSALVAKMRDASDPESAKIVEAFNAGKKEDSLYIAIGQGKWDAVKAAIGEAAAKEFQSFHPEVLRGIRECAVEATTTKDPLRFANLHALQFVIEHNDDHGHEPLPAFMKNDPNAKADLVKNKTAAR